MRTSRFSEEQIIRILQQAERGEESISTLCREHGITETTFYRLFVHARLPLDGSRHQSR